MSPHRTTAMDGFEQVKRRPQQFRCTLCASAYVMDRDGMMRHAKEEEHKTKVKERAEVGWAEWEGAAEAWGQAARGWDAEVARWMPSEEEVERERAERDKTDWIVRWIEAVEAARGL